MVRVPENILAALQGHFHDLICQRAGSLIDQKHIALPQLALLLTSKKPKAWFPIPGMYGGFAYCFEGDGQDTKLISESWCRVVGRSGQRHGITAGGYKLLEEGFA